MTILVEKHPFLSISFMYDFLVGDVLYKSVEHYYLANKYINSELQNKIGSAPTLNLARYYSSTTRQNGDLLTLDGNNLRSDWGEQKVSIMLDGVRYKFKNEILRGRLLKLGNSQFESKRTPWLARILNIVREEIKIGIN